MKRTLPFYLTLASIVASAPALAQAPATPAAHEEDKTGTDPSKFLKTLAVFNEYRSLGEEHGFNESVFRYIQPVEKVKFQVTFPIDGTDVSGVSQSSFGDVGLKASYLPRKSAKFALVLGLDTTYPTATKSTFGTGKYVASPGATFAFFFNAGKVIFAPSVQQKFSYAGEAARNKVSQTLIDTYFVYKPTKTSWVIVDPQFVQDYENDAFFNQTEVEYGRLMFAGVSTYVRPGIGLGEDKPLDWNLEFGVKVIH